MAADNIIAKYDTLLLDLDGVVYEGENAIEHAVETISMVQASAIPVGYITNNSSRKPETIANQLRNYGITLKDTDVISSAQSGVEILDTMISPGSKVLVVGGEGLRSRVSDAGYQVVDNSDESPAAVIQGFAPDVSWTNLAEAGYAIQKGAKWVATNQDWTIPREKGLAPGNGTLVSAVHTAVGQLPVVAGKPEPAIFETALRAFGSKNAIYVGDRLDTDVAGANKSGLASALVMTGVTTRKELLATKEDSRPDYILQDMSQLLATYQAPIKTKRGFKCGEAEVELLAGRVLVTFGDPKSLDALKAACTLIWDSGLAIHTLQVEPALYE